MREPKTILLSPSTTVQFDEAGRQYPVLDITASWFWNRTPSCLSSPSSPPSKISPPLKHGAQSDDMPPKSYDPPALTPQFCFNSTQLRDFLRLSRTTIDDSITQNLNSLLTPGEAQWDPSSVHSRQISVPPGSKRPIDGASCRQFREKVLFPSWQSRSDVLNYCASVATSPDPDDPDLILREVESERRREVVVDERLDPYSARFFPVEPRTEYLAANLRRERAVEDIIRRRTWELLGERCAGTGKSWEEALDVWRKSREGKRS